MSNRSDDELFREFLEGSIEAFETLVVAHKDNLIYFIQNYVHDIFAAEDLAQDVFVDVYVDKRYTLGTNFKAFLFTIGHNKAVDYIRKNKRLVLTEEVVRDEEFNQLEDKVMQREAKREVIRILQKLKEEYRMVILLVDFYQLTYKEAARVLNKNEGQLKVLVHRARKALQKQLVKEKL